MIEYVARHGDLIFTTAGCIAVLAFARLGRKQIRAKRHWDIGMYQDENGPQPISALALAGYPARRGVVDVFACNSVWEVIGDLLFDSGQTAMEGAEYF